MKYPAADSAVFSGCGRLFSSRFFLHRLYNGFMKQHSSDTPDSPAAIDEQAIAWFARLRSGNVTDRERALFRAWLLESPAHAEAYRQIDRFWAEPELQRVLGDFPLSGRSRRPFNVRPRFILALAASLAIGVVVYRPLVLGCLQADYCTGVGEVRSVQLADGSRAMLNSASALTADFRGATRRVRLMRGEAYFEVRRDPGRPFQVEGNYSVTRVVGTRFSVREEAGSDTVTVVSGLVEVGQGESKSPLLKANERIRVTADSLGRVQPTTGDGTAWTRGKLLFDNARLDEVVAEIGRYRRGAVVIRNERLKGLKVSGRFDLNDTDRALQSLAETLPIRLYRLTPWLVIVG